ncbi:hypothetical protein ACTVZO_01660 [Streptomyces sp. IBSNAI002]|uniref:hypothetical protein n=1 Tax=Streptomyces sp. IBSNAI002 TaxID=3457500 RepID=UPI003FD4BCC2
MSSMPARAPVGGREEGRSPLVLVSAEAAAALLAALLLVVLCMRLRVNPMTRIGQVSGLAGIQLRFLALLGATVLVYALLSRLLPETAVRIGAAAVAGLATGVTASGSVVGLRGTSWPIYANVGDIGNLQQWAYDVIDGVPLPPEYPPGFPHVLAWTSQTFFDGDVPHASKWVMIGLLAITGPAAYLAWRLLLPPLWALGIGVTAALPLVDPYKPYSALVLMILIPVLAKLVQAVTRSGEPDVRRALVTGAGLGLLFAVLFLLYAGWFLWSSIGVVALFAALLVRLLRRGGLRAAARGLIPLAAALAAFLAPAGHYLVRLLGASGATKDAYFYFDTHSDPAYFAMWGASTPGPLHLGGWPPLGELGGVGLFSIVLIAGTGAALALGLRRPLVMTLAACTASAFVLRYWYASHMERDQVVQLYPRTSHQILYCLIALTGLAAYHAVERIRERVRAHESRTPRSRATVIGALCALGMLFGTAGSSTADSFMPKDPREGGAGQLAWYSHNVRLPTGECPRYAHEGACEPYKPPERGKRNAPAP